MRLAWVSPLPPARSGIADYSAELLPALDRAADVTLFAPDPWDAALLPGRRIFPLTALPEQAAGRDLVVYHIGNNPFHVEIYDLAMRLPGVVVLHDYVLHHLVARCTLQRGDLAGYAWHQAYERGAAGAAAAIRRALRVYSEREQFLDPLNRALLDRCRGAIVHSRRAADRIRQFHPTLPLAHVPHHRAPPLPAPREESRRLLGIAPHEVVLASFGFITPSKGVDSLLRAYARLRPQYPHLRCFLVGEPEPGMDLAGRLARLGLEQEVTITGYIDMESFYGYIAACDIAVALRYPTAGETSGALLRLLGSGKAVITSNLQQFAEWPDDVCLKVDPGPRQDPMLRFYLQRLLEDPSLRAALGENARRYVEAHHALERSSAAYLAFLRRVAGRTSEGGSDDPGKERPLPPSLVQERQPHRLAGDHRHLQPAL